MSEKFPRFETPEEEAERYISFLEAPAEKILQLLREKIDNQEYDSVLGDDAGGRVHALILGKAIKEIYGDEKHLEIVFVKGGRLLKNSPEHTTEVEKYLEGMKDVIGKRTLIVTEEILGGESVEKLALILRSLGIEAEVATFQTADPLEDETNPIVTSENIKIYNGEGHGGILEQEHLGVWDNNSSENGHAVARIPYDETERQQLEAIRESAKNLAHKLSDNYLAQETN